MYQSVHPCIIVTYIHIHIYTGNIQYDTFTVSSDIIRYMEYGSTCLTKRCYSVEIFMFYSKCGGVAVGLVSGTTMDMLVLECYTKRVTLKSGKSGKSRSRNNGEVSGSHVRFILRI